MNIQTLSGFTDIFVLKLFFDFFLYFSIVINFIKYTYTMYHILGDQIKKIAKFYGIKTFL